MNPNAQFDFNRVADALKQFNTLCLYTPPRTLFAKPEPILAVYRAHHLPFAVLKTIPNCELNVREDPW